MNTYWKIHDARWSGVDFIRDPDGLGNVCYAGAPLWLNQYYARFQRRVFQQLFRLIRPPQAGARALDIGCGAGRWCRFLATHGYETVGIDLQPELMKANRRRHPHVTFIQTSILDYEAKARFDLVTSVTVIQHIPFDQQALVIRKLREILTVNGYVLALENIHDAAPYVFSHTIQDWQALFAQAGFRPVTIRRYDYSPFLRLCAGIGGGLLACLPQVSPDEQVLTPESFLTRFEQSEALRWLYRLYNLVRCAAVIPDTMMEALLVQSNIPLPTAHCGFLFQVV